jgi:hypothetical protein
MIALGLQIIKVLDPKGCHMLVKNKLACLVRLQWSRRILNLRPRWGRLFYISNILPTWNSVGVQNAGNFYKLPGRPKIFLYGQ